MDRLRRNFQKKFNGEPVWTTNYLNLPFRIVHVLRITYKISFYIKMDKCFYAGSYMKRRQVKAGRSRLLDSNDTVERSSSKKSWEGGEGRGDQLSHNSRKRRGEGGGDTQRVTHCPKGRGVVRVVVVVESTRRMIYLGRAPLSLSLPFSPSRLMLISSHRNCTKARHVWSVNFCHHKSIGHARGGGSFRRMGGGGAHLIATSATRSRIAEIQTLSNVGGTWV